MKLVWYKAVIFPINNVNEVMTIMVGTQKSAKGEKQVMNKRKNAAKPAVFTTVDMKAVISVGDPS